LIEKLKKKSLSKGLLWGIGLLIAGCTSSPVSQFEAQRPARLTIKKEIKKIFIDPAMIQAVNDKLGIKNIVLRTLQQELNQLGRFQAIIGPVRGVDPEKEVVAVVQGNITSGEEIEIGQFTEVATCQGGISGFAAGATAAKTSRQGVTVSRRGLICKASDFKASVVGAGVGALLSLAGVQQRVPPVDEVVRVYKYKNFSLFAQVDFSLTMIGTTRQSITIRSDSANFSRHVVQQAINVHESYLTIPEVLPLIISPVSPLFVRRFALVEETNPGHARGRWYASVTKEGENLAAVEKYKILKQLVSKSLKPFIRTISPYKVKINAVVAEGDENVRELIFSGQWKKAQARLQKLPSKTAADWYNLGLTFEATATTVEDYEEAKRLYLRAFNMDEQRTFAQGIGRMEKRLKEARKLAAQTSKQI